MSTWGSDSPPLLLVRHADADARGVLTAHGLHQAAALAQLRGTVPAILRTSPAQRCIDTLRPLGELLATAPLVDDRLASGASHSQLVPLLDEALTTGGVVCSHNDVLPLLLERLWSRWPPPAAWPAMGPPCGWWRLDRTPPQGGATWTRSPA